MFLNIFYVVFSFNLSYTFLLLQTPYSHPPPFISRKIFNPKIFFILALGNFSFLKVTFLLLIESKIGNQIYSTYSTINFILILLVQYTQHPYFWARPLPTGVDGKKKTQTFIISEKWNEFIIHKFEKNLWVNEKLFKNWYRLILKIWGQKRWKMKSNRIGKKM